MTNLSKGRYALAISDRSGALQNDGSSSSLFVTPRTYYPEI